MSDAVKDESNSSEELHPAPPLPEHSLPRNNPLVLLEHVNLNIGTTWTEELEEFFFAGVLGCLKDSRADGVLDVMRRAGSHATDLRWANVGFQQFHLVGCSDPTYYTRLEVPWANEQAIDGVVGLEWMAGDGNWKELRRRLEWALANNIVQNFEEESFREEKDEQGCSAVFRITACHGNNFQIRAQQVDDDDFQPFFVGPVWPPPLVKDIPFPLPSSNKNGYCIESSSSAARSLGMRFVEYFVPHCEVPLGSSSSAISSKHRSPLDVIEETYGGLFPGLILSRRVVTREGSSGAVAVRDQLQVLVGHEKNPQYLRFTQLSEEDSKRAHPYDGHHVAIYVNDFVGSYQRARRLGLVFENPVFPQFSYKTLEEALKFDEFRFRDFIDRETGTVVFLLEHETRSLRHRGFARNKDVWNRVVPSLQGDFTPT